MWRKRLTHRETIIGFGELALGIGFWITSGGLPPPSPIPLSYWIGIGLMAFGIVSILYSLFHTKTINEKPTIKELEEKEENDAYYLLITNGGAKGEFTAQITVKEDSTNRYKDKKYVGYWTFDTSHLKSLIKKGQSDKLKIVHLNDKSADKEICLDYYDLYFRFAF